RTPASLAHGCVTAAVRAPFRLCRPRYTAAVPGERNRAGDRPYGRRMGNQHTGGRCHPRPGATLTIERATALARLGAIYAFGVPHLDLGPHCGAARHVPVSDVTTSKRT